MAGFESEDNDIELFQVETLVSSDNNLRVVLTLQTRDSLGFLIMQQLCHSRMGTDHNFLVIVEASDAADLTENFVGDRRRRFRVPSAFTVMAWL